MSITNEVPPPVSSGTSHRAVKPPSFSSHHVSVLCVGTEALDWVRKDPLSRMRLRPVGFFNPYPSSVPQKYLLDIPEINTLHVLREIPKIDLVLLSVPNTTKNQIALEEELLASGHPVACMKWRLQDWNEDSRRLIQTSQEKGVPYLLRDSFHHGATVQTARRHLHELGTLQTVYYRFSRFSRSLRAGAFSNWVHSYRELVLEDLAYHHFSVLEFLLGFSFLDGQCVSRATSPDPSVHNTVDLVAETNQGWILNYSADWGLRSPYPTSWLGDILLSGDKGWMRITEEEFILNGRAFSPKEWETPIDWIGNVLNRLEDMSSPASCLLDAKAFLPVTDAIAATLRWVDRDKTPK